MESQSSQINRREAVSQAAGPSSQRLLSADHFAFMRALVQGLDLRESWDRYLAVEGSKSDLRLVKKTVRWIRVELANASRRHNRHGTARLMLAQLPALTASGDAKEAISLEEFVINSGMEDFSEAEQIEAYQSVHGTPSTKRQRQHSLIKKQLDALSWLSVLVEQKPQPLDHVLSWFAPSLVQPLIAAGIQTLEDLLNHINGVGKRWVQSVPGIGVTKGARIVEWLQKHEATLRGGVGRHVGFTKSTLSTQQLSQVTSAATDIRPLEKFIVPTQLDGSAGAYRRPQAECLLDANTDYDAIVAWLRSKHGMSLDQRLKRDLAANRSPSSSNDSLSWINYLSHTQRAYRKEAERFLLWAIVCRGKPLSSITHEDCQAYRDFLSNPQPVQRWCGSRRRERWSPLWRPFEGPLSISAQAQAITILKNLYRFLVDQNYLFGNPWSQITPPVTAFASVRTGRSFTNDQWLFITQQLELLPNTSANLRLKLAIPWLYATGIRLSEAVALKVGDLQWVQYPPTGDDETAIEGWLMRVLGKGMRLREVPVPDELVQQLKQYLSARGLKAEVSKGINQDVHVFGKATDLKERAPWAKLSNQMIDASAGVTASTFYLQLKKFFKQCANAMRLTNEASATRFEHSSTHWLRHTCASHSIEKGIPLEIVQQNLGHASLATTTIYLFTEEKRRMKAMQKIWK